MARFDKEAFLQAEYTDALDTERTLFPMGEYVAEQIESFEIVDPKPFVDEKTGAQKDGSPQLSLRLLVREDHAVRVREQFGYPADRPVYCSTRFFLDIDQETGWLEFGPNKNIDLGKIRAALGQNDPGVRWSFTNLKGAGPIAFVVKHEKWEKNGKEGTSERISGWASVEDMEEAKRKAAEAEENKPAKGKKK